MLEQYLLQINQLIASMMISEVELINQITVHMLKKKGKRIRTKLTLLACKQFGEVNEKSLSCAGAVELLHSATLLHDDVIDESATRRGSDTANHVWGNSAAVLAGDFLYSLAFQLLIKTNSIKVMNLIANGARKITEAEVWQLSKIGNVELKEIEYFQIINGKTASLFEISMTAGALLGGASDKDQILSGNIGRHLGMAFQLVDDMLDYSGEKKHWTKEVGDDLSEGKITLPMIHFLKEACPSTRKMVIDVISVKDKRSHPNFEKLRMQVAESEAMKYTKDIARKNYEIALDNIQQLQDTSAKELLIDLANSSISRKS